MIDEGGREQGGWVVVERSTLFLSWTMEEVGGGLRYDGARYVDVYFSPASSEDSFF